MIAQRHGLAGRDVEFFERGSVIVAALGPLHVLKLETPLHREHHDVEVAVLQRVAGRLPIATPEVTARGELESWPYFIMSRVPGAPLAEVWNEIPERERLALCERLGEVTVSLNGVPVDGLPGACGHDYAAFLARQREECVARQARLGLGEPWLGQIETFLAKWAGLLEREGASLLHTELMRDHAYVERGSRGWALSGLIDFESAMAGHPEHELASVGLFVTGGDAACFRAFLRGFGANESEIDRSLSERALAHALLHRSSNLPWWLKLAPPGTAPRTLDEAMHRWWRVNP